MGYTLAGAAAATGLNKTTILRAIKSGRISGTKNELGEWQVEPAEAHRIYPPVAGPRAGSDALPRTPPNAAEAHARAFLAEQQLSDLKALLADMQADRDAWRNQAQRLLIADQRANRPWWKRIAG